MPCWRVILLRGADFDPDHNPLLFLKRARLWVQRRRRCGSWIGSAGYTSLGGLHGRNQGSDGSKKINWECLSRNGQRWTSGMTTQRTCLGMPSLYLSFDLCTSAKAAHSYRFFLDDVRTVIGKRWKHVSTHMGLAKQARIADPREMARLSPESVRLPCHFLLFNP